MDDFFLEDIFGIQTLDADLAPESPLGPPLVRPPTGPKDPATDDPVPGNAYCLDVDAFIDEQPVGIFLGSQDDDDYAGHPHCKIDAGCCWPVVPSFSACHPDGGFYSYDHLDTSRPMMHLRAAEYPFHGLPTPTEERSMSFSSASSGCSSDLESASPLFQARQLRTPPPSPLPDDSEAMYKQTLVTIKEEHPAPIPPPVTMSKAPTVSKNSKPKGVRGVPDDQFFVMENAFTPSPQAQPASNQVQPTRKGSASTQPTPSASLQIKGHRQAQIAKQIQHALTDRHHTYIPPSITEHYIAAATESDPLCTADQDSTDGSPSPTQEAPKVPFPIPATIAPVRASTSRSSAAQHPKPFHCELCPASFSRKHDLKRHTRIHLGIRPFKCGACGKVFSRHDALNRHVVKWGCDRKMEAMAVASSMYGARSHGVQQEYDLSPNGSVEYHSLPSPMSPDAHTSAPYAIRT
ncbi:hypothetical protein HDU85_001545 [Gaertneriomyces sp. JEL0708]|nr:hypothetical protein HDU85_001545 [Gaertneriomyces sp. JEL0708]